MTNALLASFFLAASVADVPVTQRSAPARVFVHTEPGGEASELAARQQSVKDLTAALAGKKKVVAIVETQDDAEIVIEVLDRGVTIPRVVIGMGARPGQPPGHNAPVRTVVLRVELKKGEDAVVFKNKNTPFESPGGWKSAADDLAKQIEKWIADRGTVSSHDVD
jgi:hypothetical protein